MGSIVLKYQGLLKLFRAGLFLPGFILICCCLAWTTPAFSITYPLQLNTNNLSIYAEESVSPSMQKALQRLDKRIDDFQLSLGVYIDTPAPIYLVKNSTGYANLALGKAKIVEFSDAFYSGAEKRIYLRPLSDIRESYINIMLHEYIHWYLEKIFVQTPLWFHEGMAVGLSGQMGFERYVTFLQQSFWGKKVDLFRMSYAYPDKKEDWQIFYLSSSMAVRFMSENKQKQWQRFWELVAQKHRKGEQALFSECFAYAYRVNLYDFHTEFKSYVKHLRFQYLFWSINSVLAILLPFVLILASHYRKKRLNQLPDLPEVEFDPEDPEEEEPEEPLKQDKD